MPVVEYEWDVEEWGGDEILDHDFHEDLEDDNLRRCIEEPERFRLVLVRDVIAPAEGVIDRLWAYATVKDGKLELPMAFEQAGGEPTDTLVPIRFKAELARKQGDRRPLRMHV